MRGPLSGLFVCSFLSGLSVTVLAEDDPDYSPAANFRPYNVTGLNGMYSWVGSYYNATTEVEVTPLMGDDITVDLCLPLQGYSTTMKWNSILAITERGPYNEGSNPFNLWLTLMPPNYNWSTLPWHQDIFYVRDVPFWWVLMSSLPTWREKENTTVPQNFNITSTKSHDAFSFQSTLVDLPGADDGTGSYDDVWMTTCNSSHYYGNWTLSLLTMPPETWWSIEGWKDYKLPKLNGTFDAQTANFTLDADFRAYEYVRSNVTNYIGTEVGEIGRPVQGTIRFTFKGVLDTYHSDVLNMNTSSPTWLRTVGFGNNSLNIADSAVGRLNPGLGAATIVTAFTLFAIFY